MSKAYESPCKLVKYICLLMMHLGFEVPLISWVIYSLDAPRLCSKSIQSPILYQTRYVHPKIFDKRFQLFWKYSFVLSISQEEASPRRWVMENRFELVLIPRQVVGKITYSLCIQKSPFKTEVFSIFTNQQIHKLRIF